MEIIEDPSIKKQSLIETIISDSFLIIPLCILSTISMQWTMLLIYIIVGVVVLASLVACLTDTLDARNTTFRRMSSYTIYLSSIYKILIIYLISMNIPLTVVYITSVAFLASKYLSVIDAHDMAYTKAMEKVVENTRKYGNMLAKKAKDRREKSFNDIPPEQ